MDTDRVIIVGVDATEIAALQLQCPEIELVAYDLAMDRILINDDHRRIGDAMAEIVLSMPDKVEVLPLDINIGGRPKQTRAEWRKSIKGRR